MNPYPLAPLNHFTVPFSLTDLLLSPYREEFILPTPVEAFAGTPSGVWKNRVRPGAPSKHQRKKKGFSVRRRSGREPLKPDMMARSIDS